MSIAREISRPGNHELAIGGDYQLTIDALADMGWSNPEEAGIPSQASIERGLQAGPLAAWLIERADTGQQDSLVIAPKVGGQQGIGVNYLITRHSPNAFSGSYVWSPLWGTVDGRDNPYGNRSAKHDNAGRGLKTMWDVAILLGDTTDPATGDQAYDPGLAYTSKTVPDQREAFKAEAKTLKAKGITIVEATVGAMVVDSAGLRLNGQPQHASVTRFIHYKAKYPGGGVGRCVPSVGRDSERLDFYDSVVSDVWYNFGARRLARVEPLVA